jgi:hypothetical protein
MPIKPDETHHTKLEINDAAHAAVIEIALAERLRSATAYAARIERFAEDHEVPISTLRATISLGQGPKTFTIGRLIYCRRVDWAAWLDRLARTGGTGPLSPPAGRTMTQKGGPQAAAAAAQQQPHNETAPIGRLPGGAALRIELTTSTGLSLAQRGVRRQLPPQPGGSPHCQNIDFRS